MCCAAAFRAAKSPHPHAVCGRDCLRCQIAAWPRWGQEKKHLSDVPGEAVLTFCCVQSPPMAVRVRDGFSICSSRVQHCLFALFSSPLDITQAMQEIASVKPRQKALTKKIFRKKEIMSKDITDGLSPEKTYERTLEVFDLDQDQMEFRHEGSVTCEPGQEGLKLVEKEIVPEDVPDGAQISKAFDKLCNIVREKIRVYKRPEAKSDSHPKGRYVLVTGEGGYEEPCFLSSSVPAGGGITVSTSNGKVTISGDVEPIPELPEPTEPSEKRDVCERREEFEPQDKLKEEEKEDMFEWDKRRGKIEQVAKYPDISEPETTPSPGPVSPTEPGVLRETEYDREDKQDLLFREAGLPGSMSYEKVEVVESIEKFSDDRIQTYEETAMIVETMIEKTSKKKPGDKGS